MRLLLVTPPLTQINTPYPATAYLTGFLRGRGFDAVQADPSLTLVLRLFSRAGLSQVQKHLAIENRERDRSASVRFFMNHADDYLSSVDNVISFLQGKDPTLCHRIVRGGWLPEGPRFRQWEQWCEWDEDGSGCFGALGIHDKAQHLASLYLDDLADVIRDGVDARFELSRYAEKIATSAVSFTPLEHALKAPPTLVDRYLDEITLELVKRHSPTIVGMTVPFPGNVYGAFRMAQAIKRHAPQTTIIMGGGYVNTELRELSDARVFQYVDYITLDDGQRPLLSLLDYLGGKGDESGLCRTFALRDDKVTYFNSPQAHDIPFKDAGIPVYDGLPVGDYLSLCELLNPMHRLWSDGRWNKLTLAHGCYWKKCTFCDTSLDYIERYETQPASELLDRIEALVKETGQTGFHFVDEAAPPAVLSQLADGLIERRLNISWWGNIRFEKAFTPALAKKLAKSGCIALSGGLEVASDRLLQLMDKGVTVEQVARVTHAFTEAGIMVHAYLMFGFPSQTEQETIDALERVRQLFASGCLQSAFWHRFSVTTHSPVGKNPEKYGITLHPPQSTFAKNDVPFEDSTGVEHGKFFPGLNKAVYNYMLGMGLEEEVRDWFDFPVPKPKVPRHLIERALH